MLHWTRPWQGERFSLCFFSAASEPHAATAASIVAAMRPPFRIRPRSTDANVVVEVLGRRPCYAGPPPGDPRWPDHLADFSPSGHRVLDAGAHIGAFARWALDGGAESVVAYEPEPANARLFRANVAAALAEGRATLREAALVLDTALPSTAAAAASIAGSVGSAGGDVASDGAAASEGYVCDGMEGDGIGGGSGCADAGGGGEGVATLVLGRARTDGVENTWRHALAGLSHYSDDADAAGLDGGAGAGGGGGTGGGGASLQRVQVTTVPFFSQLATHQPTFVKLDCEGAELALLARFSPGAWRGVTRLVFEWSFTKERRLGVFSDVMRRLEAEGFTVMHEGRGGWETTLEEWPWPTDAVVYAAR